MISWFLAASSSPPARRFRGIEWTRVIRGDPSFLMNSMMPDITISDSGASICVQWCATPSHSVPQQSTGCVSLIAEEFHNGKSRKIFDEGKFDGRPIHSIVGDLAIRRGGPSMDNAHHAGYRGAMTTFPTSPRPPEDRAARLALIRARAEAVFKHPGKAWQWLNRHNRVLAQNTALDMIETDSGFESVLGVLGRIEHGVYS